MIEYTFDEGEFRMPDDIYGQILSHLGYPFITEDELEYPREQIVRLAIVKGIREYFHWCPPTRPQVVEATGSEQIVKMPSDCYGVVGLQLQQAGGGNVNSTNVFGFAMEQSMFGGGAGTGYLSTGSYHGLSAPKTNLNGVNGGSLYNNRALRQSITNYYRRVHYDGIYTVSEEDLMLDEENPYGLEEGDKYIKVYSNTSGALNIWWARKSLDWSEIEFAQQQNVIDYCSACVKELFGNLRRQGQVGESKGFDYGKWLDEAKATKEAITKDWKALTKYSGIMRGSL